MSDASNNDKWVTCPHCSNLSCYASSNAYRPFCSKRCQLFDLGAWASGQFVVPELTSPDADLPADIH